MYIPRKPIAVTGIGLASSLGTDVVGACAAARAGISRPADGEFEVVDRDAFEVLPITGHPAGTLTLGFAELGRWVRLGTLALANLLQRSQIDRGELSEAAFLINLPSDYLLRAAKKSRRARANGKVEESTAEDEIPFSELIPYYQAEIAPKIFHELDVPLPKTHQARFEDQTGVVSTLAQAGELLEEGRVSRCIVGGVDSLLEPQWLHAYEELGVLKTPVRPIGLMPGEAAAFLLVETVSAARRGNKPVLALLTGLRSVQDVPRFSDPPPSGMLLAQVIRDSLQQAPKPCKGFFCDLNGDSGRAQEWGLTLVRLQPDCMPSSTFLPALAFGDTRAAYGYVAACMATQAFARDYAPSDSLLVCTASDAGARASFVLGRGE
jgi:3-oxoacyl-[acyl-carrier-protein] synthase-1